MSKIPALLIDSLKNLKGFNESAFLTAHDQSVPVSVRMNPFKITEQWKDGENIGWCDSGIYLKERPSFTLDPIFHAGCYYVQEASSMFLEQALKSCCDLTSDIKILDLCAAPGGKSTLISSLITNNSMLVSNEVIKTRVPVLCENLIKWGSANTYVTNNDASDFARLQGFFDVIVVDAPCSGSGLFRKDADAMTEWSEANVNLCSQRQQRILADVFPALKENGIIIYSTCSYSKSENEDVLDFLKGEFEVQSSKLDVDDNWGIIETESDKHKMKGYRFYPDKAKGEGFFIACMRKVSSEVGLKKKSKFQPLSNKEVGMLGDWVKKDEELSFFKNNNFIHAIPKAHEEWYDILTHNLYLRKAGVCLGELMRDELIPDHQLALSLIKNANIASVEVDKESALKYLRKENISVVGNAGWNLVTHKGYALGWAKLMQNRMNNYYPKEWRIRMG